MPVFNYDVASVRRIARKVEHHVFGFDIEIKVNFHSAFVRVARHRVPYAALFEFRHTHYELTTVAVARQYIFVNSAFVAIFFFAALDVYRVCRRDEFRGIFLMSGATVKIELRGIFLVIAEKRNFFRSSAEVKAIAFFKLVLFAVRYDIPFATDIDRAHFTPFEKIFGAKFVARRKRDAVFVFRNNAADDDSVDMRIHEIDFIDAENVFNKQFFAYTFAAVRGEIFFVYTLSDFHFRANILL